MRVLQHPLGPGPRHYPRSQAVTPACMTCRLVIAGRALGGVGAGGEAQGPGLRCLPLPRQAAHNTCIARQPRTCRVCGVAWVVEDMQHFLLECPSYARVRQSWVEVFGQQATTTSVLGQRDQCRLAATVSRMLQQRELFLQGGVRE